MTRRWVAVLLFAIVVTTVAACGGDDKKDTGNATTQSAGFVGKTGSGGLSVALVPGQGGKVMAYVCDGDTVSEWFEGSSDGKRIDLRSASGARLSATVSDGAATGTVTTPSNASFAPGGGEAQLATYVQGEAPRAQQATPKDFRLEPSVDRGGLYRGTKTVSGRQVLAGWVAQNDSSVVGGVELQNDPKVPAAGAGKLDLKTQVGKVGNYAGLDVGTVTTVKVVARNAGNKQANVDTVK